MPDDPGPDFVPEDPIQEVRVDRQRVLRKDRVAELLEFIQDAVVQPRVMNIRTALNDHTQPVLAFEPVESLAGLSAKVPLLRLRLASKSG